MKQQNFFRMNNECQQQNFTIQLKYNKFNQIQQQFHMLTYAKELKEPKQSTSNVMKIDQFPIIKGKKSLGYLKNNEQDLQKGKYQNHHALLPKIYKRKIKQQGSYLNIHSNSGNYQLKNYQKQEKKQKFYTQNTVEEKHSQKRSFKHISIDDSIDLTLMEFRKKIEENKKIIKNSMHQVQNQMKNKNRSISSVLKPEIYKENTTDDYNNHNEKKQNSLEKVEKKVRKGKYIQHKKAELNDRQMQNNKEVNLIKKVKEDALYHRIQNILESKLLNEIKEKQEHENDMDTFIQYEASKRSNIIMKFSEQFAYKIHHQLKSHQKHNQSHQKQNQSAYINNDNSTNKLISKYYQVEDTGNTEQTSGHWKKISINLSREHINSLNSNKSLSKIVYKKTSFQEQMQKVSEFTDRNSASLQKFLQNRKELLKIDLLKNINQ